MILQRGGLRQRMLAMKTKALLAILLALASCGEENRTQKQVDDAYVQGYEEGKKAGYEQGKKAGYEQGYEEGYEEGHDEGYREKTEEIKNIYQDIYDDYDY